MALGDLPDPTPAQQARMTKGMSKGEREIFESRQRVGALKRKTAEYKAKARRFRAATKALTKATNKAARARKGAKAKGSAASGGAGG